MMPPVTELLARRVEALEAAVQEIIDVARAGEWEGPEIPDVVGAAIAHAALVLRHGESIIAPAPWCPVCGTYHLDPGERTDAGVLVRQCSRLSS